MRQEADGETKPPTPPLESGILRRALGNAGLLLGGKGAAGLMQLATLALAARTLGLEQFGLFSVMLAQMQLLITVATFQSNQAIVRYGVPHLNDADRRGFQLLAKFGSMLDVSAALVAGAAALLLAPVIARSEGWDQEYVAAAQLLALLPLMNAIATPKGVLRLFGRFDLLARQVIVTPLARLAGTAALAITGGSLLAFAMVWVIAAGVGALVILFFAWRESARRDMLSGIDLSLSGAVASNPGIWRFSVLANLHSSFALLPPHIATLAMGLALGPAAAGLTKVAQEIGTAVAKPIDLVNQTVYPDITRLAAGGSWKRLRKVIVRTGASAVAVGALMTLLLFFIGESIIRLVFGPEYEAAYWLLLLISLATAVKVSMFAAEPTLYALGRPSLALIGAVIAVAAFATGLFVSLPELGVLSAGLAYLAAALAMVVSSFVFLRIALPRHERP